MAFKRPSFDFDCIGLLLLENEIGLITQAARETLGTDGDTF